jgi:hypothetical protein
MDCDSGDVDDLCDTLLASALVNGRLLIALSLPLTPRIIEP